MVRTLSILVLLPLAACNQASTEDSAARSGAVSLANASPEEVARQANAAQAANAVSFRPGQWETTVEVIDVDMPQMPGGMREQMIRTMKGTRTTVSNCLTRDAAKKPGADMFAGSNAQCRYDKFAMSAGRIDATMHCTNANAPGTMRLTTQGSYDADSFSIENAMTMNGPMGGGQMHTRSRVTGRRLGDCKS